MDIIINSLSSKEVVATCIFILTIYSGYFAFKFRTYGDIKAKIQNLPDLEDISRAQANGQHSAEFEYYKMKNDFDKLSEFTNKVTEYTFKVDDLIQKRMRKRKEMMENWGEDSFHPDSLKTVSSDSMEELTLWIRETKLTYILHLKKYKNDKFDVAYKEWSEGNLYRIDSDLKYNSNFNSIVISKSSDDEKRMGLMNDFHQSITDAIAFNNNAVVLLSNLMDEIEILAVEITASK